MPGDASKPPQAPALPRWLLWLARGLTLLIMLLAGAWVLWRGDELRSWAGLGYPAIFLVCLLTNSSVVVPLPGLGITVLGGAAFNPLLVGLVGGLGQTLGALNSYLAGYTSHDMLAGQRFYARVAGWMASRGRLTIFVLATLPNPFFSLAVMVAAATGMPLRIFVPLCLVGKVIKSGSAALVGYYGLPLLRSWLGN